MASRKLKSKSVKSRTKTKSVKSRTKTNRPLITHPYIYQKKGDYGMGTYANHNIPVGTIIIKEKINNISDSNDNDYSFKLIQHLLQHKKEDFLSMVPDQLDETVDIDYNTIRDRHKKYLPELTEDQAKHYFAKYKRNAFSFDGQPGILFYATRMNHSCDPHTSYYKDGDHMAFKTIRPIKKGDEIYDSYINYKTTAKPERQEMLKTRYGFTCNCEKCLKE
jgi:hypothetical protein